MLHITTRLGVHCSPLRLMAHTHVLRFQGTPRLQMQCTAPLHFRPAVPLHFRPAVPLHFQATPVLLAKKKKKKKKAKIIYQFRSTALTGQFTVHTKGKKSRGDRGQRAAIMIDRVLNRPVVWKEAKLKSGKNPQYKGYRSKAKRRPEAIRAEKLKDKEAQSKGGKKN